MAMRHAPVSLARPTELAAAGTTTERRPAAVAAVPDSFDIFFRQRNWIPPPFNKNLRLKIIIANYGLPLKLSSACSSKFSLPCK